MDQKLGFYGQDVSSMGYCMHGCCVHTPEEENSPVSEKIRLVNGTCVIQLVFTLSVALPLYHLPFIGSLNPGQCSLCNALRVKRVFASMFISSQY